MRGGGSKCVRARVLGRGVGRSVIMSDLGAGVVEVSGKSQARMQ